MKIVKQEVIPPVHPLGRFFFVTTFDNGTAVALDLPDLLAHRTVECQADGHDWLVVTEYGCEYPADVYCRHCGADSGLVQGS